jgi:hypothetical protein
MRNGSKSTAQQIEEAAKARQRAWLQRPADAIVAARQTRLLDDLFEERRQERARTRYGDRDQIVRRARVEVELERLVGAAV